MYEVSKRLRAVLFLGGLLVTTPVTAATEEGVVETKEYEEIGAGGLEGEDEEVVLPPVVTTSTRLGPDPVDRPSTTVSGDELTRSLGNSVPATLEGVPGFNVQYNGPGAASPTVRGMPGDRVLMLEDGHLTGDIYWTASDHGVMMEPLSAQSVEVFRGPSGLIYGANALGGVVNVVRDDVPTRMPLGVEGTVGTQFESVNTSFGAGAVLRGPLGSEGAFHLEGTGRMSGSTRTPAGTLEGTEVQSKNFAGGLSWLSEWGLLGGSVRYYDNVFGVPGEFNGELIPGGHPGGVTADAQRVGGRVQAEYQQPLGVVDTVALRVSGTRFRHDEMEGVVGGENVLGARFLQTTVDSHLLVRHVPLGSEEGAEGVGSTGALGLAFQMRELEAGGSSPGTRSGRELSFGAFGFEEIRLQPFRLQVGGRFDLRDVRTPDLSDIRVRTLDRNIQKSVAPRTFQALSGSLAFLWDFAEGWTAGTSVSRSFRAPRIEELYSDGPHLADFSYDIGSPDLDAEVGSGADVFLRAERDRLKLESAVFASYVDNYIYYNPTGEYIRVYRDRTAPRVTPVFEARGDDALFLGGEARVQWEFLSDLWLDVTGSYTRATRLEREDPLPFIPPLSGRIALRYDGERFFGSLGGQFGAAQNRVPRPIQVQDALELPQTATENYTLVNAMIGWRHSGEFFDQTLILNVRNVADAMWFDHMSRIKEIAPQPGRNIQLTYQATF